jgi:hypothetical protein
MLLLGLIMLGSLANHSTAGTIESTDKPARATQFEVESILRLVDDLNLEIDYLRNGTARRDSTIADFDLAFKQMTKLSMYYSEQAQKKGRMDWFYTTSILLIAALFSWISSQQS